MLKKWRQLRRDKLVGNTIALYVSFVANKLVPLVTVPYTVRVLTPTGYGEGAFAASFAGFAGIVAAYGFGLTASREISVNRADPKAVSRITSEVVSVELSLLALCVAACAIAITLAPRLCSEGLLMWIALTTVAFTTLTPNWLYQGLEELKLPAQLSVALKLAYVPALFLFVRKPTDVPEWLGLQSAAAAVTACFLWVHARRRLGIRFVRPSWPGMIGQLRQGFAIFFSQSAVSLYTSGNVFILGILTNVTIAGYYSVGEKLVKLAMSAWGPLTTAVFPRASQLASESREAALRFARKMLILQGGMGAALSLLLLATAPWVVPVAFGSKFGPSVPVLQILSVLPFLIAVSNVLGIQVMIPFKHDMAVAGILLFAGLANVALASLLVPIWGADGMAASVLLSEVFVTSAFILHLRKTGLNPLATLRQTSGAGAGAAC